MKDVFKEVTPSVIDKSGFGIYHSTEVNAYSSAKERWALTGQAQCSKAVLGMPEPMDQIWPTAYVYK